jgi:hypothetical protein
MQQSRQHEFSTPVSQSARDEITLCEKNVAVFISGHEFDSQLCGCANNPSFVTLPMNALRSETCAGGLQ